MKVIEQLELLAWNSTPTTFELISPYSSDIIKGRLNEILDMTHLHDRPVDMVTLHIVNNEIIYTLFLIY